MKNRTYNKKKSVSLKVKRTYNKPKAKEVFEVIENDLKPETEKQKKARIKAEEKAKKD